MGQSEIRTRINRNTKHVFETYAQPDPWLWSDIRSVRWTHGEPWEVESRLSIEPANSFGVIVDQVITHFEPYRRVDFISHFGGVTMVSQVVFSALDDDATEVRTHLEFVGSFSRMAGLALGPAIEYGARRFYEFLKQECERESPAQNSTDRSDAG
jgi:hypothetical protein